PDVTAQLEPALLIKPFLNDHGQHMLGTLGHAPPAAREPHSLPWRMQGALRVGTVVAVVLILLSLLQMIRLPSDWVSLSFYAVLVFIATGFITDPGIRTQAAPGRL